MSQLALWSDGCVDGAPLWDEPVDGIPARWRDLLGQIDLRDIARMTTVEVVGSYL